MRNLKENKQKLFYALLLGETPIYKRDDEGNIIYYSYTDSDGNTIYYTDEEGNRIPLDTGEVKISYGAPVEFYGNIAMSSGEIAPVEYGIDASGYSAVLKTEKGLLPIDETSRIWFETEPQVDEDGGAIGDKADYTVVKVSPSLNVDSYILQKAVK